MIHAENYGRLLVVSPHLDDAVLACGEFLAGHPDALVVTVFAGFPAARLSLTDWDRGSGFSSGVEAIASRRDEDCRALARLHAKPLWLDFLDSQYGETPQSGDIASELCAIGVAENVDTVLMPLGLYHSDHELTHEACLLARSTVLGTRWIAYEDALYRRKPGCLQRRLSALQGSGVLATPASVPRRIGTKVEAIRCYASQLRALADGGLDDTMLPENHWLLEDSA